MPSQNRLELTRPLSEHDARDASTLLARQFTSTMTATAVFEDRKDTALIDATDGAVNATLPPGSEEIIGLGFWARKVDDSGNAAGLACAGDDTFADTTTSLTTTTNGAEVGATWDGTYWRPLPSTAAGGPVSAETLSATTTITAGTTVTTGGNGTGAAAAAVNINKTAGGTGDVNWKAANTLRARARLDANENLIIDLFDTDGVTSFGSITIAVTTGIVTTSKGIVITTGGLVVSSGNVTATLGNLIASAGFLVMPDHSYADDTAAGVVGVPVGGLYHTTGAVKRRLA